MSFRPTYEQVQLLKYYARMGVGQEQELSAVCKEVDCSWEEAYLLGDVLGVLDLRPVHCEGRLYASINPRGMEWLREMEVA